jgi:hypothetical protein
MESISVRDLEWLCLVRDGRAEREAVSEAHQQHLADMERRKLIHLRCGRWCVTLRGTMVLADHRWGRVTARTA